MRCIRSRRDPAVVVPRARQAAVAFGHHSQHQRSFIEAEFTSTPQAHMATEFAPTATPTSRGTCDTCVAPGVIASVAYRNGVRAADVAIDDLAEAYRNPDWFLWVGLYEPDEELLRKVQTAFGLHDQAVEDAHNAHQRPKLEHYGDDLFVVLRTARQVPEADLIEFGETHVFVGPRYVVSVRHGSFRSHVGVRARCEADPRLLALGPGYVLYALMDFVVDQYFPIVDARGDELAELEARIFAGKIDREAATRIYHLKRDLLALKRATTPLVSISSHLMRTACPLVTPDTAVRFQDVNDHILRIVETIDGLQELSTTALTANLSLISLSQNADTRRLASWAAILAVPTMVAGIYGMNFVHMPEKDWELGYPLSLGVMLGVCLLLYRGFKRSKWL
jgi:magnesium transporter